MLGGKQVRDVIEMHAQGKSIREICRSLRLSRNTVRKYLRSPGVPPHKKRPPRDTVLGPFEPLLRQRLVEGVDNCVVLLRELRAQGYPGGYSTLKEFVRPLRPLRRPKGTVRFETQPGEQAQVDFGHFRYQLPDGGTRHVWGFALVLSWSRAIYVEFVPRADTVAFIQCHLHAFEHFGGMPERCLYDNTKTVVVDRNPDGSPLFNSRFLDFALRLGFRIKLCHPYRPQTKGRVESAIKYVRGNFWPTARFVDLDELNQQARAWVEGVADVRVHGTTGERPLDRLQQEKPRLSPLPGTERLQPFLREERKVGRDSYVRWQQGAYGVQCVWIGETVQIQGNEETVEIWSGDQLLVVHPRATRRGQHFAAPNQWVGLPDWQPRRDKEPLAVQVQSLEVERRALAVYDQVGGR